MAIEKATTTTQTARQRTATGSGTTSGSGGASESGTATGSGTAGEGEQAGAAIDETDEVALSDEAREDDEGTQHSVNALLGGMAEGYEDPEAARMREVEETTEFLHRHQDWANGSDEVTSREDYEEIARGEKTEDFENHLREENPDWTDEQVEAESQRMRETAQTLIDDEELFNFLDTGHDDNDDYDGKISTDDLESARLRNDISKDTESQLGVDEILELHEENPGLGNQAISNRYYHQAQGLNELIGGGQGEDFMATWPAYAQLASNSAGSVIRSDGIPGLPGAPDISGTVAAGNRKVFEDIAPHYDSYLETFNNNPDADIEEWIEQQGLNEPPDGGDRNFLGESFRFLDQARQETDPDRKQELLLASNALAARHEQENLDPELDDATAPVTGTGVERAVLEGYFDEDPTFFIPNGSGEGELDEMDTSQRIEAPVPEHFERIDDPEVQRALLDSLRLEDTPENREQIAAGETILEHTGTEDWADFDERMRHIMGLMVAGQNDPRLSEYVLDYDLPDGLSVTDHVGSFAEQTVDRLTFGLL